MSEFAIKYNPTKLSINTFNKALTELNNNFYLFKSVKQGFNNYKIHNKNRKIILIRNLKKKYTDQKILQTNYYHSDTSEWLLEANQFPETKKIIEEFGKKNNFKELGKVMFALLPRNEEVNWHTDPFPIYSAFTRFHIPFITTKDASSLISENKTIQMKKQHIYPYNTQPMHKACNKSNKDRVHLIFDFLIKHKEELINQPKYIIEVFSIKIKKPLKSSFILNNPIFRDTVKLYETGLIFFLIYNNPTQSQIHILWNSAFTRKMFYDNFNINSFLKIHFNLIQNETRFIKWKDTYKYYDKIISNEGFAIIDRKDYR